MIDKYLTESSGDKEGGGVIEERHEFNTVEEIINYFDENAFLKKDVWILN